jgi:hypothetical protein
MGCIAVKNHPIQRPFVTTPRREAEWLRPQRSGAVYRVLNMWGELVPTSWMSDVRMGDLARAF